MLSRITIKNFALIDEMTLEPGPGLTIITGETGSGKSIMLGALSLLLGARADVKAAADPTSKIVVEAEFDSGTILRREVAPSGRSRAFVDDSPVTLAQLEETASRLIDVHSQHANLRLNTSRGQLEIIDAYARTEDLLKEYRTLFRRFVEARHEIKRLKEGNALSRERREIIEYQLGELDKLNPRPGEAEEVENLFDRLSDADELRESVSAALHSLDSDEDGALAGVTGALGYLEEIRMELVDPQDDTEEGVVRRLQTLKVELADITRTLADMASDIESDPRLLAKTAARMQQLHEATKKFNTADPEGLVTLRESLRSKLKALDTEENDVSELEKQAKEMAASIKELADTLSARRREAAGLFAAELEERARPLGLQNLHFAVDIQQGKLSHDGQDTVCFLCAFNKSENGEPNLRPMADTASGGELSRLTLAIKSIMAAHMEMPTIIFDEIDTGVSGSVADSMGGMMTGMAQTAQVMAITHLPQVAAKGERHFKVYKEDSRGKTLTHVRMLTGDERIEEIAAMISGKTISRSALDTARELLCHNCKDND